MTEYILLMHCDTTKPVPGSDWPAYFDMLNEAGVFRGGSQIGDGACFRREGCTAPMSTDISGFVKIETRDQAHARKLLNGNPVFEAGGTIEIRELPRTG